MKKADQLRMADLMVSTAMYGLNPDSINHGDLTYACAYARGVGTDLENFGFSDHARKIKEALVKAWPEVYGYLTKPNRQSDGDRQHDNP